MFLFISVSSILLINVSLFMLITCVFNMILLLITWEFHIIHPNLIHFPTFPGPPPSPGTFLQNRKLMKNTKSNLYCPYSHWHMVKLQVAKTLMKTEAFPTPTLPFAIYYDELYSSGFLLKFLGVPFKGFLCRLILFDGE